MYAEMILQSARQASKHKIRMKVVQALPKVMCWDTTIASSKVRITAAFE